MNGRKRIITSALGTLAVAEKINSNDYEVIGVDFASGPDITQTFEVFDHIEDDSRSTNRYQKINEHPRCFRK